MEAREKPLILVVDDQATIIRIMSNILKPTYDVCVATNGRKAIDVASEQQPDLILMDISLPEINGWELAPMIRRTEGLQEVPIIAVTAHAMAGDEERSKAVGCDDYVAKPINEDELLEKVEKLIGK